MSDKLTLRTDLFLDGKIAVAVSGGSDSLALLYLLVENGFQPIVLTVNHGLRSEAAQEAAFVGQVCASLKLQHHILNVDVEKTGNLQANARDARYDAMKSFCIENKMPNLLVGHTKDDQNETFLMNAMRGSGVDGLRAMDEINSGELTIIRPILEFERQELQTYLSKKNVKWVNDPSNINFEFSRVKVRDWINQGQALGFDFEGLSRTRKNMARVSNFVETEVGRFFEDYGKWLMKGVEYIIPRSAFLDTHEEIQLRVLARLAQQFGGSGYKPRIDSVIRLRDKIHSEVSSGMNVANTDFHWSMHKIRICAEPKKLPPPSSTRFWHLHRIDNSGYFLEKDCHIDALGNLSHKFDFWRAMGISHNASLSIPAVFKGDEVIALKGHSETIKLQFVFNKPLIG